MAPVERINPVNVADAAFAACLVEMYGELRHNNAWDITFDEAGSHSTQRPVITLDDCEFLYNYMELYLPHAWKARSADDVADGKGYDQDHLHVFAEYSTWAELIADSREV